MTNRHDFRLDEKLGLDRVEAAAYMGVGTTLFDAKVAAGEYPAPHEARDPGAQPGSRPRLIWNRKQLELAFDAQPVRLPAGESQGATAKPQVVGGTDNPWQGIRGAK